MRSGLILRDALVLSSLGLGLMLGCDQSKQGAKPSPSAEQVTSPEAPAVAKPADATPEPPLGLPPVPVPADNPMTAAKIELGKLLYFDPRLSKSGEISCATCHIPTYAYAEPKPTSVGHDGQVGDRNANSVINTAYLDVQFWDGRAASLEEQAAGPIENPIEMASTMSDAIGSIDKIDEYKKHFKAAFGSEDIDKDRITKAIATFERTILSGNSPYDKFEENGDKSALTEAQQRGLDVFMNRGQCATCHTPPIFSNSRYYNAGIGMDKEEPDIGRMKVTGKERDKGSFRVAPLREVAHTAPYFHDGSVATLDEAVKIMAAGGIDNENLSSMMKSVRMEELSDQDVADLVEFLKALSGEYPVIEEPALPGM